MQEDFVEFHNVTVLIGQLRAGYAEWERHRHGLLNLLEETTACGSYL
jgi:hypothetical protein